MPKARFTVFTVAACIAAGLQTPVMAGAGFDVPAATDLGGVVHANLWDAIDAALPGDTIRINAAAIGDTHDGFPRINIPTAADARTIAGLTIMAVEQDGVTASQVAITSGDGAGGGDISTVLTVQEDAVGGATTSLSGLRFYLFTTTHPLEFDGAGGTLDTCAFIDCDESGIVISTGTGDETLTVTSCTFDQCGTSGDGAGISAGAGTTMQITGGTFTDCDADVDGGGIAIGAGSEVDIDTVTFTNCDAIGDGGAIHTDGGAGGTLDLTDCDFTTNSADSGGAVSVDASATCVFSGGTWLNNTATVDGGHIAQHREAIGGASSVVAVTGATFNGGTAGDQGGVLFGSGTGTATIGGVGSVTMDGSQADFGGAIAVDQGFAVVGLNVDITNCQATTDGGGVHVGATASISLMTGSIESCDAQSGGAGHSTGTLSLNGYSLDGNQATGRDGGHLYFAAGSDGSIQACDFDNGQSAQGGGAVLIESTGAPAFSGGCTFDGHVAGTNGGDVDLQAGAAGSFADCTFTNGTATGNGGSVHAASDAETSFTDCTITTPSAVLGGGMYLDEASITVTRTDIDTPTITGDRGCGLYVLTTTAVAQPTFTDGSMTDCDASFIGGGLYLEGTAGRLTMLGTAISLCDAVYGGGSYVAGANPELGATFSDNTATYYGGGTYIEGNSDVTMTDAQYLNNISQYRGGGIYMQPMATAEVTWTGGLLQGNASPRGGGIQVSDNATASFNDVVFWLNTSSLHGAGLSAYAGSTVSFDGCTFDENTCPAGGGIYMWGVTSTFTSGCVFDGNSASWGAAIYSHNTSVSVDRGLFSNNTSNYDGGAVYLKGGMVQFTKTAFYDNNSSVYGDVDGMAIVGTSEATQANLDNCYFGDMLGIAVAAANNVTGGYEQLVQCNVGQGVVNHSGFNNLGGGVVHTVCPTEADLLGIINGSIADDDGDWLPDVATAAGDINGDGAVGPADLLLLLQSYGEGTSACDIDQDGTVGMLDLIALLRAWSV